MADVVDFPAELIVEDPGLAQLVPVTHTQLTLLRVAVADLERKLSEGTYTAISPEASNELSDLGCYLEVLGGAHNG